MRAAHRTVSHLWRGGCLDSGRAFPSGLLAALGRLFCWAASRAAPLSSSTQSDPGQTDTPGTSDPASPRDLVTHSALQSTTRLCEIDRVSQGNLRLGNDAPDIEEHFYSLRLFGKAQQRSLFLGILPAHLSLVFVMPSQCSIDHAKQM